MKRFAPATLCLALLIFAACDDTRKGTFTYGTLPTRTTNVGLILTPAAFTLVPGSFGCVPPFALPSVFDLALTASSAVFVNQVTFRLGDGSTVGGPSVTFPQPVLQSQFGTLQLAAGLSRVFSFTNTFGCGLLTSPILFADVTVLDGVGTAQTVTTSRRIF